MHEFSHFKFKYYGMSFSCKIFAALKSSLILTRFLKHLKFIIRIILFCITSSFQSRAFVVLPQAIRLSHILSVGKQKCTGSTGIVSLLTYRYRNVSFFFGLHLILGGKLL